MVSIKELEKEAALLKEQAANERNDSMRQRQKSDIYSDANPGRADQLGATAQRFDEAADDMDEEAEKLTKQAQDMKDKVDQLKQQKQRINDDAKQKSNTLQREIDRMNGDPLSV